MDFLLQCFVYVGKLAESFLVLFNALCGNIAGLWDDVKIIAFMLKTKFAAVSDYDRAQVIAWVRTRLPEEFLEGTGDLWSNGVIFCAVVDSVLKGACASLDLLTSTRQLDNTKDALKLMEKYIGIKPVVTADELCTNDKQSEDKTFKILSQLMTVAQRNAVRSTTRRKSSIISPNFSGYRCIAKGMGLFLAVRGRWSRFNIFFECLDHLDIALVMQGPKSTYCCLKILKGLFQSNWQEPSHTIESAASQRKIPLQYEVYRTKICVSYVPLESGKHELLIMWHGQHIKGSPFAVTVDESSDVSDVENLHPEKGNRNVMQRASSGFHDRDMISASSNIGGIRRAAVVHRRVLRRIISIGGTDVVVENTKDLCSVITRLREQKAIEESQDVSPNVDKHSRKQETKEGRTKYGQKRQFKYLSDTDPRKAVTVKQLDHENHRKTTETMGDFDNWMCKDPNAVEINVQSKLNDENFPPIRNCISDNQIVNKEANITPKSIHDKILEAKSTEGQQELSRSEKNYPEKVPRRKSNFTKFQPESLDQQSSTIELNERNLAVSVTTDSEKLIPKHFSENSPIYSDGNNSPSVLDHSKTCGSQLDKLVRQKHTNDDESCNNPLKASTEGVFDGHRYSTESKDDNPLELAVKKETSVLLSADSMSNSIPTIILPGQEENDILTIEQEDKTPLENYGSTNCSATSNCNRTPPCPSSPNFIESYNVFAQTLVNSAQPVVSKRIKRRSWAGMEMMPAIRECSVENADQRYDKRESSQKTIPSTLGETVNSIFKSDVCGEYMSPLVNTGSGVETSEMLTIKQRVELLEKNSLLSQSKLTVLNEEPRTQQIQSNLQERKNFWETVSKS